MPLQLKEIRLTPEEGEELLPAKVAHAVGLVPGQIHNLSIVRSAIDARKKPKVYRVFTVEFEVRDEQQLLRRHQQNPHLKAAQPVKTPVLEPVRTAKRALVVGMGPAGLFAAWHLARCGLSVTLIEQGRGVEDRVKDVRSFWNEGILDPQSNVQFGEGGAGTFSDGKLTTRIKHPGTRLILDLLVRCGAPEEILIQAKPHVGSDRLRLVLIKFRSELQRAGVEVRYCTRLTGLVRHGGAIAGAVLNNHEDIGCDVLVLAPGHSARETYRMLETADVQMEAKPFAVGVRVEHPVELINQIQYGTPSHPRLPAADYALSWNDRETGRGIYSFCMCPGGEVVNASSAPGMLVVNGMSLRRRNGGYSNSALVVTVGPADFPLAGPGGGVLFQEEIERSAFRAGGGNYCAPAQNLLAFLKGGGGQKLHSSCRPGVREADLGDVLPGFVSQALRRALPHFDRRMRGFISAEAVLVAAETRTSAPLRILRGSDGQSLSHPGLYPAGEGAGYAGGIMSAALDGLRSAQAIVESIHRRN